MDVNIAIGHPLGASGGRVLGTLAARLRASGERWGVAAICIGVGQGLEGDRAACFFQQ